MCGRTGLSLNKEQICCACSYKVKGKNVFRKPEWLNAHNNGKEYMPSYNIAPTEVTPVLVSGNKYKNYASSDRVLIPMMWGLIPPWHKGNYKSHNLSTNNCRLEGIKSSKLYNPILRNGGRCVIIAEGFYEWQTTDKSSKAKKPFFIYASQDAQIKIDDPETWDNTFNEEVGWHGVRLLYMAGLYHAGQDNDYSYSIITTDSNNTLSWLHHRMPVILDTQEQIEAWLDIDNIDADMALSCLKPGKLLSYYEVSTVVNNSRNKSKECNKRLSRKNATSTQKTLDMWLAKAEKRKTTDDVNPSCKNLKVIEYT